jgi:hypothetical protein
MPTPTCIICGTNSDNPKPCDGTTSFKTGLEELVKQKLK